MKKRVKAIRKKKPPRAQKGRQRGSVAARESKAAAGGPDAGERTKRKEAIAEVFSVHWRTVVGWARAGCPHAKTGRAPYMFDAGEVAAWLRDQGRSARPGRPAAARSPEAEQYRTRKEKALAERYEMDLAERRGEMIDRTVVAEERVRRILAVKTGLLGLVEACPAECENKSAAEIREVLESRIHAVLRQFAGTEGGP